MLNISSFQGNAKTKVRYHYIPIRIARIKKMTTSNAGEDTEKLDFSYTTDGNVKWYSHLENSFVASYKTKHKTTAWPSNCTFISEK